MLFFRLKLIFGRPNVIKRELLCKLHFINNNTTGVIIMESKSDLSRFKLITKPKLSTKNTVYEEHSSSSSQTQAKRELKREHIKIDSDSSSNVRNTKQRWTPPNWEKTLANIREMRKNYDAPVDSMGCNKCQEKDVPLEVFRYQALVSLMLSSQTKDNVTYNAMLKLQQHGCNIDQILATPDEKLQELIYPVGFYKTKVKNIKKTTEILKKDYNGDIPKTVDELCKLPGVGPKMAHLCMKTAWDEVTGIGVDTHVHRVSNRLGWVNSKTPEQTRKSLEAFVPQDLWDEVGLLLVGFGQQVCQPVKPQCTNCLNKEMCEFGKNHILKGAQKK